MFVDEVDIQVPAGDGGRGCLSFRREKFVPRGGPSGGDGGPGGSVHLVASPHLNTLINFRFHPEFHAERGAHGQGSNRTGRAGGDLELEVPVGTVAYEYTEAGLVKLADLARPADRVRVARGGRGGRGNARFATPTNRAPRRVEPGEPGEKKRLHLRLKLLADVGLVGFPNAGKSTLISRISSARPKIADYPFTTLTPHLGVVSLGDDRSFVVADVPGLIEGAHRGHGLGDQFLSHLERTKVLVHVIDVSSASARDPVQDFEVIDRELSLFRDSSEPDSPENDLARKPRLAAATKIDALDDPSRLTRLAEHMKQRGIPLYAISAVTGEGIDALLEAMWQSIDAARRTGTESSMTAVAE
ncbi:MAG: GTPase ObgE [Acidobacteria bacterium]|nr:GTPase ObgE [Acidobacteriota bacterium]